MAHAAGLVQHLRAVGIDRFSTALERSTALRAYYAQFNDGFGQYVRARFRSQRNTYLANLGLAESELVEAPPSQPPTVYCAGDATDHPRVTFTDSTTSNATSPRSERVSIVSGDLLRVR